jgi:hypothetical protein
MVPTTAIKASQAINFTALEKASPPLELLLLLLLLSESMLLSYACRTVAFGVFIVLPEVTPCDPADYDGQDACGACVVPVVQPSMMETIQEADIIGWLRSKGFQAEGASLSKAAVSKLLKGGAKTWSQIIKTWPADSKANDQDANKPQVSVKAQQQAKELQEAVRAQREANKRLEELVIAQQVLVQGLS